MHEEHAEYTETILNAMATALWVSSWADYEEEKGTSFSGQDLMDVAPETPDSALGIAEELKLDFEKTNDQSILELFGEAVKADIGEGEMIDDMFDYADEFGHYLAMQAMGHGVSWFDGHAKFPIKFPHIEVHTSDGENLYG